IFPTPDSPPLYTDLYNASTHELVEAKASARRADVRMGIGQLADYRRFLEAPRCVLLLPQAPSDDLLDLLRVEGIGLLVPDGEEFIYILQPATELPKASTQEGQLSAAADPLI